MAACGHKHIGIALLARLVSLFIDVLCEFASTNRYLGIAKAEPRPAIKVDAYMPPKAKGIRQLAVRKTLRCGSDDATSSAGRLAQKYVVINIHMHGCKVWRIV